MSLYFVPVLPDESAETVRAGILSKELIQTWKVSLPVPTCSSTLEEVESSEVEARHRYLSFVDTKCKKRGNDAEKFFLELVQQKGWTPKFVKDAADYDYKHHVDCMLKVGDGKEVWVDVKSMRSLRRGWSLQSEYMWVELHEESWLMGGKSTVIAQEVQPHVFLLFDRAALASYVKKTVQVKDPVVPYAEQSFLRVFMRPTKGLFRTFTSYLSLVKTEDAFAEAGCGILM